ncbi:hypothetical protein KP509_12G077700 [Ceratopteris richardii]|uniref:Uncharacterized protein n=1 Tax=Ceratopteris richardii TaxID=49495 RepID=A0A8T2TKE5_CERRI|nr:hypothetical protein KP509_12G077700 [Ceratopteris richardii]
MNPMKWLRNQTVNEAYPLLLWIVYALRDVKLEDKQSWLMDVLEMVFCSTNSETVVVFLALLTSSWCPYSTFILVDGSSVLQLLPFTLSSLLSEQSWRAISKGPGETCGRPLVNMRSIGPLSFQMLCIEALMGISRMEVTHETLSICREAIFESMIKVSFHGLNREITGDRKEILAYHRPKLQVEEKFGLPLSKHLKYFLRLCIMAHRSD